MTAPGRRLHSRKLRAIVLIRQEGRCAYCNTSLHGCPIEWDHFVPFAYLGSSGGEANWVAACYGCNRKKRARMFSSTDDIAEFCVDVITDHGAFGEGWPEGTEIWQRQLASQASNSPNKGYSLLPDGFDTEAVGQ